MNPILTCPMCQGPTEITETVSFPDFDKRERMFHLRHCRMCLESFTTQEQLVGDHHLFIRLHREAERE